MATNVVKYISNLGKSVAYVAQDTVKDKAPAIGNFTESNADLFKGVYESLRNYKTTYSKMSTLFKNSKVYEALDVGIHATIEDIQTGKFYNKERKDRLSKKAFGMEDMGFGDMLDAGGDIDLSFDEFDLNDEDFDMTDGDVEIVKSVHKSSESAAAAVSMAVAKTGEQIIKSNQVTTNLLYSQNIQLGNTLATGFSTMNQNMGSLLSFSNDVILKHVENSAKFYADSTNLMIEQRDLLKKLVESTVPKEEETKKSDKLTYDDITSGGIPDLKEYFKLIKQNVKNQSSMFGMLSTVMDMGGEEGNPLLEFASSPLEGVIKFALNKALPKSIDKAMGELDKSIENVFSSYLLKMNGIAQDEDASPILQAVAKALGVNTSIKSLETDKYNKGKVDWDGKSRKALIEVIPGYLSKIVSLLSGQSEKIYDYDTGKYIEANTIDNKLNEMHKQYAKSATSDVYDTMKKMMEQITFRDINDKENLYNDVEKILQNLYDNAKIFEVNSKKEDAYFDYGVSEKNYEIFRAMFSKLPKSMRQRLNAEIINQRASESRNNQNINASGDSVYNYLSNGFGINEFGPMYRGKKNTKFKSPLVRNNLLETVDNKGRNVFFYLQNMYKELVNIRTKNIRGTSGEDILDRYNTSVVFRNGAFNVVRQQEEAFNIPIEREYRRRINARSEELQNRRERFERSEAKRNERVEQRNELALIDYADDDVYKALKTRIGIIEQQEDLHDATEHPAILESLLKTKDLEGKVKALSDFLRGSERSSISFLTNIMNKADQRLYEMIYGTESGDGKTVKGFLDAMILQAKTTFGKLNDYIDDKILKPLSSDGEDNLFTKLKNKLNDMFNFTEIKDRIKSYLFGDEGEGGLFRDIGDSIKDTFKAAGNTVKDALIETLSPVKDAFKGAYDNYKLAHPKEEEEKDDEETETISAETSMFNPANNPNAEFDSMTTLEKLNYLRRHGTEQSYNKLKDEYLASEQAKLDDEVNTARNDVTKNLSKILGLSDENKASNKMLNEVIASMLPNEHATLYNPRYNSIAKFYEKGSVQKLLDTLEAQSADLSNSDKNKVNKEITNNIQTILKDHGMLDKNGKANLTVDEFITEITRSMDTAKEYAPTERSNEELALQMASEESKATANAMERMRLFESVESHTKSISDMFKTLLSMLREGIKCKCNHNDLGLSEQAQDPRRVAGLALRPDGTTDVHVLPPDYLRRETYLGFDEGSKIPNYLKNRNIETMRNIQNNAKPGKGTKDSTLGLPTIPPPIVPNDSEGLAVTEFSRNISNIISAYMTRNVPRFATGGMVNESTVATIGKNELVLSEKNVAALTEVHDIINSIMKAVEEGKTSEEIFKANPNLGIDFERNHAEEDRSVAQKVAFAGEDELQERLKGLTDEQRATFLDSLKYHNIEYDNVRRAALVEGSAKNIQSGVEDIVKDAKTASKALFGDKAEDKKLSAAIGDIFGHVKEYAPGMISKGLLGAGVSLVTGMIGGPMLGAAVGAGASLISDSEKAKSYLFGDLVDGERQGGVVSKKTIKAFSKYFPDMKNLGITGGLAGLLLPGVSPMAGILLGSSLGFAKNNDRLSEVLFGDQKGIFNKKRRDQLEQMVPRLLLGTGISVATGPFGLMGNILLGSALGFATGTETFKKTLFGEEDENGERHGGILGKAKDSIMGYLNKKVFDPLKRAKDPIKKELGLMFKRIGTRIGDTLDDLFEQAFGTPLRKLIKETLGKIFTPFKMLGKFLLKLAGGVVTLPFGAVGKYGDHLRKKHIREGNADYMTAEERIKFREKNNVNGIAGWFGDNEDSHRQLDDVLAGMSQEDLEKTRDKLKAMSTLTERGQADRKEHALKIGDRVNKDLKYFQAKKFMDEVKFGHYDNLDPMIEEFVNKNKISRDAADKLKEDLNPMIQKYRENRSNLIEAKSKKAEYYDKLKEFGFTDINDKNASKYINLLNSEVIARLEAKDKKESEGSEKETEKSILENPRVKLQQKNHSEIVGLVQAAVDQLKEINKPKEEMVHVDEEGNVFEYKATKPAKEGSTVTDLDYEVDELDHATRESMENEEKKDKQVQTIIDAVTQNNGKAEGEGEPKEEKKSFLETLMELFGNSGLAKALGSAAGIGFLAKILGLDKFNGSPMDFIKSLIFGPADKEYGLGAGDKTITDSFVGSSIRVGVRQAAKEAKGAILNSIKEMMEKEGKDLAEQTVKEVTEEAAEKGAKETAKNAAEQAVKEATGDVAEEAVEAGAKETAKDAAENAVKEGAERTVKEGSQSLIRHAANGALKGAKTLGKGLDKFTSLLPGVGLVKNFGKAAYGAQKSIRNGTSKIITKASNFIDNKKILGTSMAGIREKFMNKHKELMAKASPEAVAKVTEQTLSGDLVNNLGAKVNKVLNGIFTNPTIVKLLGDGANGPAAQEILEKFAPKFISAVTEHAAKAGGKLAAKLAISASPAAVLNIAFAVTDFISGYNDAANILGITIEPTFGMKVSAGLIKAFNNLFLVTSFIPENLLVDLFVDYIFPVFGEELDLKKIREESRAEVEKYNKENNTEYSLEEFNKEVKKNGNKGLFEKLKKNMSLRNIGKVFTEIGKSMAAGFSKLSNDVMTAIRGDYRTHSSAAPSSYGYTTGSISSTSANNATSYGAPSYAAASGGTTTTTSGAPSSAASSGMGPSSPNPDPVRRQPVPTRNMYKKPPKKSTDKPLTAEKLREMNAKATAKKKSRSEIFTGKASIVDHGSVPSTRNNQPYYYQFDSEWNKKAIGGYTIAKGGCGPSSVAMILSSLLKKPITPVETGTSAMNAGTWIKGQGAAYTMYNQLGKAYGVPVTEAGSFKDFVSMANSNMPIAISGKRKGRSDNPFTPGGHIVAFFGKDADGNYLINDPGNLNKPQKYTEEQIRSGYNRAWGFGGPNSISAYGGGDAAAAEPEKPSIGNFFSDLGSTFTKATDTLFGFSSASAAPATGMEGAVDPATGQPVQDTANVTGTNTSNSTAYGENTPIQNQKQDSGKGKDTSNKGKGKGKGDKKPPKKTAFQKFSEMIDKINNPSKAYREANLATNAKGGGPEEGLDIDITEAKPKNTPKKPKPSTLKKKDIKLFDFGGKKNVEFKRSKSPITKMLGIGGNDYTDPRLGRGSSDYTDPRLGRGDGDPSLRAAGDRSGSASGAGGGVSNKPVDTSVPQTGGPAGPQTPMEGTRVKALFTAYYPANNSTEGGFNDADGKPLDPSKNTMAAPSEVKRHSPVQVLNTGTLNDGKIFEVNDVGGAINKVGNEYHFDLLYGNESDANRWGKRKGEAILGPGSFTAESGTSGATTESGQPSIGTFFSDLGSTFTKAADTLFGFDKIASASTTDPAAMGTTDPTMAGADTTTSTEGKKEQLGPTKEKAEKIKGNKGKNDKKPDKVPSAANPLGFDYGKEIKKGGGKKTPPKNTPKPGSYLTGKGSGPTATPAAGAGGARPTKQQIANQPLTQWQAVTVQEMDGWLGSKNKKTAPFRRGDGHIYIDASNRLGLDPRYILAHAAWESGWGTSPIAKNKHNYFGIRAYNHDPYTNAKEFTPENGIYEGAEWIRKNYIDRNPAQDTLHKMIYPPDGSDHGYATFDDGSPNTEWIDGVAGIMATAPYGGQWISGGQPQYGDASGQAAEQESPSIGNFFSDLGSTFTKAADTLFGFDKIAGTDAAAQGADGAITGEDGGNGISYGTNHIADDWFTKKIPARKSSPYGMRNDPQKGKRKMHTGIDYGTGGSFGNKIPSPVTAIVHSNMSSSQTGGYGNMVVLKDKNGYGHFFAHLNSRSHLKEGQKVGFGQSVGNVGSTGNSTGPHLHYEVRKPGLGKTQHMDPNKYLQTYYPKSMDPKNKQQAATGTQTAHGENTPVQNQQQDSGKGKDKDKNQPKKTAFQKFSEMISKMNNPSKAYRDANLATNAKGGGPEEENKALGMGGPMDPKGFTKKPALTRVSLEKKLGEGKKTNPLTNKAKPGSPYLSSKDDMKVIIMLLRQIVSNTNSLSEIVALLTKNLAGKVSPEVESQIKAKTDKIKAGNSKLNNIHNMDPNNQMIMDILEQLATE